METKQTKSPMADVEQLVAYHSMKPGPEITTFDFLLKYTFNAQAALEHFQTFSTRICFRGVNAAKVDRVLSNGSLRIVHCRDTSKDPDNIPGPAAHLRRPSITRRASRLRDVFLSEPIRR